MSHSLKDAKAKPGALNLGASSPLPGLVSYAAPDCHSQAMRTSTGGASFANQEPTTNSAKCPYGIFGGTKALGTYMEALRAQLD